MEPRSLDFEQTFLLPRLVFGSLGAPPSLPSCTPYSTLDGPVDITVPSQSLKPQTTGAHAALGTQPGGSTHNPFAEGRWEGRQADRQSVFFHVGFSGRENLLFREGAAMMEKRPRQQRQAGLQVWKRLTVPWATHS